MGILSVSGMTSKNFVAARGRKTYQKILLFYTRPATRALAQGEHHALCIPVVDLRSRCKNPTLWDLHEETQ
jgi:hypothetical protein